MGKDEERFDAVIGYRSAEHMQSSAKRWLDGETRSLIAAILTVAATILLFVFLFGPNFVATLVGFILVMAFGALGIIESIILAARGRVSMVWALNLACSAGPFAVVGLLAVALLHVR